MKHETIERYASSSADLVYGVSGAGKIVHISEVESGLACACRCPACGKPLIAKKGFERAYHFAHEADASCRNAAETALHRLAKEISEEALMLALPAVVASYGGQSRTLHKASEVRFERAISEWRELSDVVPDLFVERGSHRLLVEFFVTHACDAAKRAELRRKGIATVEIDLSCLPRDASRDDVRQAVLWDAERYWVYHPKIDVEVAAMRRAAEEQKQAVKVRFEREVEDLAAAYRDNLTAMSERGGPRFDQREEFFALYLDDHLGIPIGGSGCFTIGLREWQFTLWRDALLPRDDLPRSYRMKQLFDWFKKRGLIGKAFRYIAPEVEKALLAKDIGFLSPYRAIEAYLDALVERGVLERGVLEWGVLERSQGYSLAREIIAELRTLRAARARQASRRQEVMTCASRILAALPEAEREGLSGRDWMDHISEWDISFEEAIETDDARFERMHAELRSIEAMILRKGPIVEYCLELPIEGERERQRVARQAEADAKEAARQEAERIARQKRLERVMAASQILGPDAPAWIETGHPRFSGRPPIEMAQSGEDGLDRVLDEIEREARRRQAQREREEKIAGLRIELTEQVTRILGDAARPFLASPYPDLNRLKPIDYCVCPQTLHECLELARKVRRARH